MRGAATVEAAIALPMLAFLMLATVELSRAFVQYTVLSDAVRDAARHAAGHALFGTTQKVSISPQLITDTRNLVVFGNQAGTGSAQLPGLTVQQVTLTDAGNNNVLVSAVYPFQPLFGSRLPSFGVGGGSPVMTFNMNIAVTMRAL
jgi:Flp pilus assembly protein TadG